MRSDAYYLYFDLLSPLVRHYILCFDLFVFMLFVNRNSFLIIIINAFGK